MKTETKIYVGIGLDFETGGLECQDCACTQIALQAIRLDTWEILERYVAYLSPYCRKETGTAKRKILRTRQEQKQEENSELMKYDAAALNYSGITMEQLYAQGVDLKAVATSTLDLARRNTLSKGQQCKPILIGQNIPFDIGFLQQLMNYAGLVSDFEKTFAGTKDYYGNFQPYYIDTLFLGRLAFAHDPEVTSYKLELMAARLGVELDDAHDAAADVTATLDVTGAYAGRLRNAEGGRISTEKQERTRTYFKI